MESFGIIAKLDVSGHVLTGMFPGWVHRPVHSLNFECGVERFGECIVETRTDASDRLSDIELSGRLSEGLAEILGTAIGVEDSSRFEAVVASGHA